MTENDSLAAQVKELSIRLERIEDRNSRVELAKRWETSRTRTLLVLLLTYFVMCLVFMALNAERIFASALIPTLGFFLSTWSLPFARKFWEVCQKRRPNQ